jgi:beclin 1-associated autophagy-related key regulator
MYLLPNLNIILKLKLNTIFKIVAENKDSVPGGNKENAIHNPAYNINAALTYATQLVNIIAYYLHVRLPYKLAYR